MIPTILLLTSLPFPTQPMSAEEVERVFMEEVAQFGLAKWNNACHMSAGPFGAGYFYTISIKPSSATALAQLIEYSEEQRHGMLAVVMRDNSEIAGSPSQRLPTILTLTDLGDALDRLTPTNSSIMSTKLTEEECAEIDEAISEWIKVRDRMLLLEAEVRYLRGLVESRT